jgi:hypothetical protein
MATAKAMVMAAKMAMAAATTTALAWLLLRLQIIRSVKQSIHIDCSKQSL